MSRETPEGSTLSWYLAFLDEPDLAEVAPFLIDWGSTPHPTTTLDATAQLQRLELIHPSLPELEVLAKNLELSVSLSTSAMPAVRATIRCPRGEATLASGPAAGD